METPTTQAVAETNLPAVIFEAVIIDEKEPVKLTADLIREKSKTLTALTIENIFDEKGYEAVKKAKGKAVKTRTSIEKIEKEMLADIKTKYEDERKRVTDYTAGLYAACKEVEGVLAAKLKDIDDAKNAEIERMDKEKKERTEAREQKMFELGLLWNGTQFAGYGYAFTKEMLHGYTQEFYESLMRDIEGAKLEQDVTGKEVKTSNHAFAVPMGKFTDPNHSTLTDDINFNSRLMGIKREYPTAVYDKTASGTRVVITKGSLADPEAEALITNDRILNSDYYIQLVR